MKIRNSIICAITVGSLLLVSTPAEASTPSVTAPTAVAEVDRKQLESDESDTRAFWSQYGVDKSVQNRLMAKIRSGGITDASRGAQVQSQKKFRDNDELVEVSTFSDGSISVSRMQAPLEPMAPNTLQLLGISGCSYTAGSGWANYKNCRVSVVTDTVSLAFYATYERYASKNAKIVGTSGASASSRNGAVLTEYPTRTRFASQSTSTQEAFATYRTSIRTSAYSETIYLSLRVNTRGTAWTTNY